MDVASLPSLIAIPNSFGAPPSSLQPGEIVDALVLAVLDNGAVRLQLPDGIIDVRTAVALAPGAKVRLAVNSTSAGLQLTVLTDGSGRAISAPAALLARGQSPSDSARAPNSAAVEIALTTATDAPSSAGALPQNVPPAAESFTAATQMAAARQGSLAPLMADLQQTVGNGTLPTAVAAAAARVLSLHVPLTPDLAAGDIRQALARSGIFLEARLANPPAAASGGADLKAALLVLRQVTKAWVAGNTSSDTAVPIARPSPPPPPYRGAPPAAQPVAAASLPSNAAPGAVAAHLLGETESALARQTLLQVASLPDSTQQQNSAQPARSADWAFEIPFATGQGTAVAQFEISRDGSAASPEAPAVWRVRFSLDVEPIGPLHAHVALLGARASVTVWAERETSAARLRDSTPLLTEALRAAALEPGQIEFRVGTPAAPPPAAGRFLDRAS